VGTAVLGAVVLPALDKGGRSPLPSLAEPAHDHPAGLDDTDDGDTLDGYADDGADYDGADPCDDEDAPDLDHRFAARPDLSPRTDRAVRPDKAVRTDSAPHFDNTPTMILAIDRRRDGTARRRASGERPTGARTPDRPGVDTSVLALTGLDMNGLGRSADQEPDEDDERPRAGTDR